MPKFSIGEDGRLWVQNGEFNCEDGPIEAESITHWAMEEANRRLAVQRQRTLPEQAQISSVHSDPRNPNLPRNVVICRGENMT
jgi:hypothetical protein